MRKISTLIILAAALLFTANATAQVTVLTHATVIDGGGAAPQKDVTIQGYSEHREMELMVQSGLTPMQVIQSFSKGASEALGIDKEFGTLAKGKTADLLVLEKNPLDNIANMRTIQAIYLGGKKFE